jgi:transposase-like protein
MPMKKNNTLKDFKPEEETQNLLDKIIREGARKMLQIALEEEVEEFINAHSARKDEHGHRIVVKNGYKPPRSILSGAGPLEINQPRIDDRKLEELGEQRFSSKILPPFMRRVPSLNNLIPILYLQGVSTDDFPQALSAILGEGAKGLSANTVVRLKSVWEEEYKTWTNRDLSGKKYVYVWADGIYANIRLEDEKSCLLVLMGATSSGDKELIAVSDGYRESKQSWKEVLLDVKARGLTDAPKLAIGDGALGFWAALREVYPKTKWQRCWVHKTANILDKMPKSIQAKAKGMIQDIYMADTEKEARKAYKLFVETFEAKYPKAVECLTKDEEHLFTFYSFPAMHWIHIRTTNPIESTFATVRQRSRRTKGHGSRTAALTMIWKLCMEAQKSWIKLRGSKLLTLVEEEKKFVDGEMVKEDAA